MHTAANELAMILANREGAETDHIPILRRSQLPRRFQTRRKVVLGPDNILLDPRNTIRASADVCVLHG